MILIASGAYLQGEFASEVGLLPPSFLPIGNKRLYEYQVAFLLTSCQQDNEIYLSIPASYRMDEFDQIRLVQLGVVILQVPDDLSLGDSLLYCWNATDRNNTNFTLLHGDTLFLNAFIRQQNAITVHANRGFYKRATMGKNHETLEKVHDDWSNDSEQVLSGFFSFCDPLYFIKSLLEAKSEFVQAIVNYHLEYPLTLITEGDWLDFGHINSFYHSRTKMTTQRSFNELNIGMRSVSKASKDNSKKIYAEGHWFDQLPLPLRLYTPALLGLEKGNDHYDKANYQLEYLYLLPLSDLLVFSRLPKGCWQTVFNAISTMLADFACYKPEITTASYLDEFNELYLTKTLERLAEYSQQTGVDLGEKKVGITGGEHFNLLEVAVRSAKFIQPAKAQDIVISHGDLCFSNMLFDSRFEAIKCIDPRGVTPSGELSIYGDRRYDLAKLYHSVIGLYDFIIAGHFFLQKDDDCFYQLVVSQNQLLQEDISDRFRNLVLTPSGYKEKEILAITVHLFLSMLPLHADRPERQQAFIANALRLFNILREMD